MDDINFDELDKAVNSALKQAPNADSSKESATADLPAVSSSAPMEQPEVTKQPAERTVPKRRGQFMDMVHPSSDMVKQAPVRTSRQGATIQPLNPSIVEAKDEAKKTESAVEEAQVTVPSEAPVEPGGAAVSDVEQPQQSEWPDPLDVMTQAEQRSEEHAPETEIAPVEESSVSQASVPSEKNDEPDVPQDAATSPFIKGPELEKRPLGAFAEPASADDSSDMGRPEPDESAPVEAQADVEVSDLPGVPQVPHELAPEVVSVESDDPVRASEEEAEDEGQGDGHIEPTGMAASISQQYKNTDEPSDSQDHPVFDTKEYHQPLPPPAKHGHTGLVVTLVILLLGLLGAGAWYAIFVLKLI